MVDVYIIYDAKYEQLNAAGLVNVLSEVADKAYYEVEDDLGFTLHQFLRQVRACLILLQRASGR